MTSIKRRTLLTSSAVLATSAMSACAGSALVTEPRKGKTFVLVHGAFHGGWCWRETAEALRSRGHLVFTPTLTGAGERAHLISKNITLNLWVEDILAVLRQERLSDVTLVGHSFGGLTIAGVADKASDRVHRLIYLDALLLENGQSAFDARPAADVARAEKLAQDSSAGVSVPAPPLAAFGLKDSQIIAAATPLLTAHPLSAYRSKLELRNPLGNGIPSAYIVCSDPIFGPLEPSRQIARAAGCQMLDLKTNHEAMLAAPQELALTLLRAV